MTCLKKIIAGCQHPDRTTKNQYHRTADQVVSEITAKYCRMADTDSINEEIVLFMRLFEQTIKSLKKEISKTKFSAFHHRYLATEYGPTSYETIALLCGYYDRSKARKVVIEVCVKFLVLFDYYRSNEFLIKKIANGISLATVPVDRNHMAEQFLPILV